VRVSLLDSQIPVESTERGHWGKKRWKTLHERMQKDQARYGGTPFTQKKPEKIRKKKTLRERKQSLQSPKKARAKDPPRDRRYRPRTAGGEGGKESDLPKGTGIRTKGNGRNKNLRKKCDTGGHDKDSKESAQNKILLNQKSTNPGRIRALQSRGGKKKPPDARRLRRQGRGGARRGRRNTGRPCFDKKGERKMEEGSIETSKTRPKRRQGLGDPPE